MAAKRRPADGQADAGRQLKLGDVPDGWSTLSWIGHLEHLIRSCENIRPDKAAEYREWIAEIQRRVRS